MSHYKNILTGIYREDPDLLLGLAEAQFANQAYDECIITLDFLREKNDAISFCLNASLQW